MWNITVANRTLVDISSFVLRRPNRNPNQSRDLHSLEFRAWEEEGGCWKLQLDDSSLQANHGGMRSIVRAQFRKDALDSALDGFLRD
jgi:hypothetical protein